VVSDYFEKNVSVKEVMAKDRMPLFIQKGIFLNDYNNGLQIRKLLRDLDRENKMNLLKYVKVIRKDINRNWYFKK